MRLDQGLLLDLHMILINQNSPSALPRGLSTIRQQSPGSYGGGLTDLEGVAMIVDKERSAKAMGSLSGYACRIIAV